MADLFSPKIVQIEAMQLRFEEEPRADNAEELAEWCNGTAIREYVATQRTMYVRVEIENRGTVRPSDWTVKHTNGTFEILSHHDFTKRYDAEHFDGVPICEYCLADPRCTPQGDPGEKLCPICSCRYSGQSRTKEYEALVLAGLVKREI